MKHLKNIRVVVALLSLWAWDIRAEEKFNVLFISIDDLRPALGCYGDNQVKTPNIDQLASESLLFQRAYCQVPVCGASRASLMTGMLPNSKRFLSYLTIAEDDVPNAVTLPEALKKSGYKTISNGKIFHNPRDAAARSWVEKPYRPKSGLISFDPKTREKLSARGRGRIYESPDVEDGAYPDGQVAEKTIIDLRRLKKSGEPFFLACGFVKPHMPFYAPKKYWDLYDRPSLQIATNLERPINAPKQLKGSSEYRSYYLADYEVNSEAWHRMMLHGYYACTSYVDKLIGDVLAELKRLDLEKNTIVVLWGDHGWHLGEHNFWGKHNTMHLSTRVPLIIKVPGKKPAVTQVIVETSDIFPTLCALTGTNKPDTVQGKDFSMLFNTPDTKFRENAYSRYKKADCIITERFSYSVFSNDKSEMLYDLKNDPEENINVAGKKEYQEEKAKLIMQLKARMKEAR